MSYNDLIPYGLNDTYENVYQFIEDLNNLHPNIIPQMAYFIKKLLHKYNVNGSIKIDWNCPLYGTVFCGKKGLRQLYTDLIQFNSKGKTMLLVVVNYWHQVNKRQCKTINLENSIFEHYWGESIISNSDIISDLNDIVIVGPGVDLGNLQRVVLNAPDIQMTINSDL
tara:strand:+ start:4015 stop:4515 length:501 start_codon:yes stop_codon:yes gene_type:complete